MTNHPNRNRVANIFEVVEETSLGEYRVISRHKTAAAAQRAGLAAVKQVPRRLGTPLHIAACGYGVRHNGKVAEIECY